MSKRQAGIQISKDDYDPDAQGEAEPTGTWQKADESVLAARKIRKAKRPAAAGGGGGLPLPGALGAGAAPTGGDQPGADAAKPNPFASIALVAPPATSAASAFGATPSPFGAAAASPFSFGAPAPAPAAGGGAFTFGSKPADAAPAAAPSSAPVFGGTAPAFSFGKPPADTAAPAAAAPASASPFVFGGGAAPASAAPAVGGLFNFGQPAKEKSSSPAPAPAPAPTFGGSTASTSPFSFGSKPATTAAPAPAPAASTTGGFSFGSAPPPATSALPSFTFGGAAAPAAAAPAPATTGGFSFGGSATPAPAPAPASTGGFAFGAMPAAKPPAPATAPPPAPAPSSEPIVAASSSSKGGSGGGSAPVKPELKADFATLNREFVEYLEGEVANGMRACDWSNAIKDYISQRDELMAGKPASQASLASAPPPPTAPPATGGGSSTTTLFPTPAAKPSAESSKLDDGSEVIHSAITKLSVYRSEKRNEENELVSEAGWKPIGKGQLRLISSEGVHFLEFRPEVSEAVRDTGDGEDEMVGKTRFGRPVLSAKLKADTPFTATKKAVQTNLFSMDAAGNPVYARYNIALGDEAKAQELVSKALACRPAA